MYTHEMLLLLQFKQQVVNTHNINVFCKNESISLVINPILFYFILHVLKYCTLVLDRLDWFWFDDDIFVA